MNRKVKSVSFNLEDPFELEMYEHVLNLPNFSSFVKRLIQNSISGSEQKTSFKKQSIEPSIIQSEVNKDFMRQLI